MKEFVQNKENKKMITKARPFARLWADMQTNCSGLSKRKKGCSYALITRAIGEDFSDIFSFLQFGETNFIFIDGIGNVGLRVRGFLCVDENPQMADSENCFFVGDVLAENSHSHRTDHVILTASQMAELVGLDAKYLVCNVLLTDPSLAFEYSIESFVNVLENTVEMGEMWDGMQD